MLKSITYCSCFSMILKKQPTRRIAPGTPVSIILTLHRIMGGADQPLGSRFCACDPSVFRLPESVYSDLHIKTDTGDIRITTEESK